MKSLLVFPLLLLSFTMCGQVKQKPKNNTKMLDFYLEYTSSTKTIVIKGTSITIQEWIEQFDNPVSSMPSSRKEVVKTGILTNAELEALKSSIKTSGFMLLPKSEYGAIAENRNYPYSITVKTGGKEKKVLYRSNPDPSTEAIPEAFSTVEKKVNELGDKVKK